MGEPGKVHVYEYNGSISWARSALSSALSSQHLQLPSSSHLTDFSSPLDRTREFEPVSDRRATRRALSNLVTSSSRWPLALTSAARTRYLRCATSNLQSTRRTRAVQLAATTLYRYSTFKTTQDETTRRRRLRDRRRGGGPWPVAARRPTSSGCFVSSWIAPERAFSSAAQLIALASPSPPVAAAALARHRLLLLLLLSFACPPRSCHHSLPIVRAHPHVGPCSQAPGPVLSAGTQ